MQAVRPRVIILGAGKPMSGRTPAGLRMIDSQKKVLDWIMHAFRGLNPSFVFVGGYGIADVIGQMPANVMVISNPDWHKTGSTDSLFKADLVDGADHYVCYGDILFRDDLVTRLANIDGLVAAIDGSSRRLAGGDAESLTFAGERIDHTGYQAEFVGLFKIPAAGVAAVRMLGADADLRQRHVGTLLQRLHQQGQEVRVVNAHGLWSNLDNDMTLARFVLGTKAESLARLQERLARWRLAPQFTVTVAQVQADALALADRAVAKFPGQPLAVRSSALCEDGFDTSNAGRFVSLLNVASERAAIAAALGTVAASYPDGEGKNQILIQPMLCNVVASGVALTRSLGSGAPYYTINFSLGAETDGITSGRDRENRLVVVYRHAATPPHGAPAFVGPLLQALQELEYVVDHDALDVEFAVDADGQLHLLQIRPLVLSHDRSPKNDRDVDRLLMDARHQFRQLVPPLSRLLGSTPAWGVMPDWNPAEIIGLRPGLLAFSLYRHLVTDEIWARQRAEFGYRDVRPLPLVRLFAGHAYVDVRASFNSFIPAGVPDALAEKLVEHCIARLRKHPELHDKVEFEIVPTCYSFAFDSTRQRLREEAGLNGDEIALLENQLRGLTVRAFGNIDVPAREVAGLATHVAAIQAGGMAPIDRARALLYECRRRGSLPFAHLARHGFVAVTLLRTAAVRGVLSEERLAEFMRSLRTVAHDLAHDSWAVRQDRMAWDEFVRKYGHLRPGTYEILSRRYADEPETYLRGIVDEAVQPEPVNFGWTHAEALALERLCTEAGFGLDAAALERYFRAAIEGRERSKFLFTQALSQAIEEIAAWGRSSNLSRSELSCLSLDQIFAFSAGESGPGGVNRHAAELAERNANWRDLTSQIELPPLLFAESDLLAFSYPRTMPNFITSKRIVAPLVSISDEAGDSGQVLAGRIVLVPRADPGFDWLFSKKIAGLITIYGGANSHMAIRAAEFGLPAAIGIGEQRFREIERAGIVELDCGSRQIYVQ